MPWFKVDDKFHSHVKAARAGVDTLGLWVICGSWAADQLTDGFVPAYIALRFDPKARSKATRLVAAGLWDDATKDGEKGWQFHDWDDMQPVRTEVEAKRHAEREKKRRWREKAARDAEGRYTSGDGDVSTGESPRDTPGDSRVRPLGSPPVPDPTQPDPTRPVEEHTPSPAGAVDSEFDAWWQQYPRKVGKGRARTKYRAARKKASAEELDRGLAALIAASVGADPRFIPHASTWLEGERWLDEAATPERPRVYVDEAAYPGDPDDVDAYRAWYLAAANGDPR